jgi:hypothetical protein
MMETEVSHARKREGRYKLISLSYDAVSKPAQCGSAGNRPLPGASEGGNA